MTASSASDAAIPVPLPQLRMRRSLITTLPAVGLPPGYAVRQFAAGDEERWAALLHGTRQLGDWDGTRVRDLLAQRPPEAIVFIVAGESLVATALANPPNAKEPSSELGWVAVSPDHQGKRLGFAVCAAVMEVMRGNGRPQCFLLTDDWRLPAISTYVRLGFEPECVHESHGARWNEVRRQLHPRR
ncbi:MAG: GNAT family N-acetyltransferase [Planctomycetes bacterium]|nr:GNAT family N-acetyltransferase [Planctomycetota bacterium]